MGFETIVINGKEANIQSAVSKPEFGGLTVLSNDPWDYVDLWLRRNDKSNDKKEAGIYWNQSREFYKASIELSSVSSPLTSYYCILNATKALLTQKGTTFKDYHGVSGESLLSNKMCLENEQVRLKNSGVLTSFCNFLSEPIQQNEQYTLKEIFYNLPFMHRAFKLTYENKPELFLPVKKPRFVYKTDSSKAWFLAELDKRYAPNNENELKNILPSGYEIDEGKQDDNIYFIRMKKRFTWNNDGQISTEFINYHRKVRKNIIPIFVSPNNWYMKKKLDHLKIVDKSQLPLLFSPMHRLSELSRYDPINLSHHFDEDHNWLLTEFLQVAPAQFIKNIACEITGKEFFKPYAASLT
jgi:hypothetical protein